MAKPNVHIEWTLGIIGTYATSVALFSALGRKSLYEFSAIILCGILIDADHISSLKLSKIRNGSWLKNKEWIHWLHTEEGLMLSFFLSLQLWSWWPLISFMTHMIIDSGNSVFKVFPQESPLPGFFHRFWPEKWTYSYF